MQYTVYGKYIKSGNVSHFKTIEVESKVYHSPSELANAIRLKCGIVGEPHTVGTLKTGKQDLCFEVAGNRDLRYMCYKVESFDVSINVSMRRVCDMLISAFEGGSTYWAQGAYYHDEKALAKGLIWYDMPELFKTDFSRELDAHIFTLHYDDEKLGEGNGKGRKKVSLAMLRKGLRVMANKEPQSFADMISENDDANTADTFLQCVVFGETVYG